MLRVSCSATQPHERDVVCVQSLHAWFDGHGSCSCVCIPVRSSVVSLAPDICARCMRTADLVQAPDICARGMRIADLVQAQEARPSQSELDELRTVDPFTYASYSTSGANGMCVHDRVNMHNN
jgi:hypothetical protein